MKHGEMHLPAKTSVKVAITLALSWQARISISWAAADRAEDHRHHCCCCCCCWHEHHYLATHRTTSLPIQRPRTSVERAAQSGTVDRSPNEDI